MPAIINADDGVISGASGLKLSSDTSGALNIQTNGVTAIAISASQAVSFPATTSLNFTSANITTLTSSSATITNLLATTLTVSSVGIFPAGSASSAAITTAGDTNTGIFFPAADTIAFTEGGAEAARFDSSGNLCVGSSQPGNAGVVNVSVGNPGTTVGGLQLWSTTSSNHFVQFGDGTAGDAPYRGAVGYLHGSDALVLYSAAAERAKIDSSGNLGLGVTPSAWDAAEFRPVEMGTIGNFVAGYVGSSVAYIGTNAYYNGGWKYARSSVEAAHIDIGGGAFRFKTAGTGTAGNAITWTQAMTLTAAGNLGLGTTSPIAFSNYVAQTINGINGSFTEYQQNGGSTFRVGSDNSDGGFLFTQSAIAVRFGTNNVERARITANGFFGVNDTAPGYRFVSSTSTQGVYAGQIKSTASTDSYVCNFKIATQTGGAGAYFLVCDDNANRLLIAGTGNVTNTNGSYGTISDAKMKTDIVDAGSQWADIKAVRFRKFKMKDDPSGLMQLGVVAQELEQTSPGLIEEHKDYEEVEVTDEEGNVKKERQPTGDTTKSVKTSVLLMKAAVALQEAMLRIEQLESKVSQLEVK